MFDILSFYMLQQSLWKIQSLPAPLFSTLQLLNGNQKKKSWNPSIVNVKELEEKKHVNRGCYAGMQSHSDEWVQTKLVTAYSVEIMRNQMRN